MEAKRVADSQFEKAKQAVRELGSGHEVNQAIGYIENLEIRARYHKELKRRPGESFDIRMELAFEYRRTEGKIRNAIYGRYD